MAQNYKKLHWTEHSKMKMKQYGLSKQKLLGILYRPEREEKGIVSGTSAVMKTNKKFGNKTVSLFGNKKMGNPPKAKAFRRARAPGEIWIMYKDVNPSISSGQAIRKIISAWRYPGVSKPGEEIPIPEDIRNDVIRGII